MIIADTGFFLALANADDLHHNAALKAFGDLNEPLITTWPVMTETSHLMLNRVGQHAQAAFLASWMRGGIIIYPISDGAAEHICQLVDKDKDLPMDLADESLVLLAEHLGHGRILSTDKRDFKTYRWKNHYPFENILML